MRGSRQARAMSKSTRFGRKEQEAACKNAEVDALYQLVAAGVRGAPGHFETSVAPAFDSNCGRSLLVASLPLESGEAATLESSWSCPLPGT